MGSARWSGGLREVPVETGSPGQHCVEYDKDARIEIGLKAGKGLIGRPGGFRDRATIHPAAGIMSLGKSRVRERDPPWGVDDD